MFRINFDNPQQILDLYQSKQIDANKAHAILSVKMTFVRRELHQIQRAVDLWKQPTVSSELTMSDVKNLKDLQAIDEQLLQTLEDIKSKLPPMPLPKSRHPGREVLSRLQI